MQNRTSASDLDQSRFWIHRNQMYGFILCSSFMFFPLLFSFFPLYILKQDPICFSCLCCNAVLLWSSRDVLCTSRLSAGQGDNDKNVHVWVNVSFKHSTCKWPKKQINKEKGNYISLVVSATLSKHKTMATKDEWGVHYRKDCILNTYHGTNVRLKLTPMSSCWRQIVAEWKLWVGAAERSERTLNWTVYLAFTQVLSFSANSLQSPLRLFDGFLSHDPLQRDTCFCSEPLVIFEMNS